MAAGDVIDQQRPEALLPLSHRKTGNSLKGRQTRETKGKIKFTKVEDLGLSASLNQQLQSALVKPNRIAWSLLVCVWGENHTGSHWQSGAGVLSQLPSTYSC